MKGQKNKTKGVLAKLIEKGIEIFLKRECKAINSININIFSDNSEIIKGVINQMEITAKEVNYKELFFNKVELQTNKLRINYPTIQKQLSFKDSFSIKMKISLKGESLQEILSSQNWAWIGSLISEKLLNSSQLKDLRIESNIINIKCSNRNNTNYKTESFEIKSKDGKIHLGNINNMDSMIIPIEDKIYINHINIVNNQININAHTEVSI